MTFDLRVVMEEVNEMLAPKAEERRLELILDYPPALPQRFLGDAGRIRQVATNLVGNAVKFGGTGAVVIKVACESSGERRVHLRISVKDSGPGVPPEKLASLFQKFSQVDASTTRQYGGTGLGLAISKQLVELMGGKIGVANLPGGGSTFWFALPLEIDASPQTALQPAVDLRGLRVLIADDNELSRRILHEQVTAWGMRSSQFASAEGLVDALCEAKRDGDPYRFAIVDYDISGVGGMALAWAIKSRREIRDALVILLAPVGQWSDVQHLGQSAVRGRSGQTRTAGAIDE
ncbi:MAG: ATP-binding protein [Ignavibacteriota bacterium]